jgi:hypothetical protein
VERRAENERVVAVASTIPREHHPHGSEMCGGRLHRLFLINPQNQLTLKWTEDWKWEDYGITITRYRWDFRALDHSVDTANIRGSAEWKTG